MLKPYKPSLQLTFLVFALSLLFLPFLAHAQSTPEKKYILTIAHDPDNNTKAAQSEPKYKILGILRKIIERPKAQEITVAQNQPIAQPKVTEAKLTQNQPINQPNANPAVQQTVIIQQTIVKGEANQPPQQRAIADQQKTKPTPKQVASNSNYKYLPRLDINYKHGNKRRMGRTEGLIPVWQSDDKLLFTDVRGWIDDNNSKEGNIGIGYRQIVNDNFILGTYGFFDHKITDSGNGFSQNTFGAELLTEDFDLRGNIYLPKDKKKETASSKQNHLLQGSNIIVGNKSYEVTHKGFDVEVGAKIPQIDDLKLFYSYYHFNSSDSSVMDNDINGHKLRGEYGLFKKEIHNLFLEGEYSNDNFRGGNSFIGLRYSVDFSSNNKNLTALEKRMTSPVYRDNDVVIERLDGILTKLQNSIGQDLKIIYVDNTATSGGDGSFEKPFNNLSDAQNNSAPYDLIYVYYGSGNIYNGNIVLKDNQKLIGQGVDLTLKTILGDSADNHILIGKVDYSKINSSSDYTITTANDNLISGLEIDSSINQGIKSENKSNLNIIDNKINSKILISSNNNSVNNIRRNIINSIDITSSFNSIQTNNISDNYIDNAQITSVNSSDQTNYLTNNTGNSITFSANNNSTQKYKFVGDNIANKTYHITGTATQIPLP